MFLKNSTLRQKKKTSNASRNIRFFYFKHSLTSSITNKFFKKLLLYKPSLSGKNSLARYIIRTKSKKIANPRIFKINYNLRTLFLGLIVAFRLIPFRSKLISLVYFSNGSFSCYSSSIKMKLFQFWGLNVIKTFTKFKLIRELNFFNVLYRIKKLSFISSLELTPGKNAQYARSSGTKTRLFKFDNETKTALLYLPSKIKKIFSQYSAAMCDQTALPEKKKLKNTKAGYWRLFGVKSIVRGVAMNAVDHPHGGRTKSIKTPLTPWGFPTKRK